MEAGSEPSEVPRHSLRGGHRGWQPLQHDAEAPSLGPSAASEGLHGAVLRREL